MNNLLVAVVLAGTIFSGCVSTKRYKTLEAERNQLQTSNQKAADDIVALNKELGDYKERTDALSGEKQTLEKKTAALSQEKQTLAERTAQLAREKELLEKQTAEKQSQYQQVVDKLQQEVQSGQLKITEFQNMLKVDLAEKIFFDSGKTVLKESGKQVLQKVGDALKSYEDKIIRVEGHTDNVPLAKSQQKVISSNWELSVLRATNVVRFLQDSVGIPPERLLASGRGEFDPVAPNDTPEGRQQNRRIEIMVVDKTFTEATGKQIQ